MLLRQASHTPSFGGLGLREAEALSGEIIKDIELARALLSAIGLNSLKNAFYEQAEGQTEHTISNYSLNEPYREEIWKGTAIQAIESATWCSS